MANSTKITASDVVSRALISELSIGTGDVTVAVKDVVDIEGFSTCGGSRALEGSAPATKNAKVVDRILDAGMRIVGKANMHELAYGITGLNEFTGTPLNSKFPDLVPGGSSSGSAAAVASGLSDWAIGTDTGGSIRVPAACCGMAAMAPDWRSLPDVEGCKIGLVEVEAEASIRTSVLRALEQDFQKISLSLFDDAHRSGLTLIAAETYAAFKGLLKSGMVGADVASRMAKAADITSEEIEAAEGVRMSFSQQVDAAFERFELLALPTLPIYPPKVSEAGDLMRFLSITALCRPFNLSGHPAITVPLSANDGKPVSLQLVAPKGEDERLVSFAIAFERAQTVCL